MSYKFQFWLGFGVMVIGIAVKITLLETKTIEPRPASIIACAIITLGGIVQLSAFYRCWKAGREMERRVDEERSLGTRLLMASHGFHEHS